MHRVAAPEATTFSLDHVVLLTADLEGAADAFARLGFTVAPRTDHSPAMGTANRCVMLGSTYLEILTVVRETERNAGWRAILAGGGGLVGLALRSADAGDAAARLNAAGFDAGEVIGFSREDEEGKTLSFRICRLPAAAIPGLRVLVCQHETPSLLWRPDWTSHPNGARDIVAATLVATDPVTGRDTLGRVAGALADAEGATGSDVPVDLAALGQPGRFTVAVDDLDRAAALAGVAVRSDGTAEADLRPGLDLILTFVPPA